MEIIDEKGKINFNKQMEKAKDSCSFMKWGYRCAWS
jgi:hypothetical protein